MVVQTIDALQGIIMNQAQYKKFPTYESAIFNFVIDVRSKYWKASCNSLV